MTKPAGQLKILLLILLAAGAIRFAAWEFYFAPQIAGSPFAPFYFPDSESFWTLAKNLSARGEYITDDHLRAWRTPLYPLVLAGFYRVFGEHLLPLRLFGIFCDLANLTLIFLIARKLFSRRAAVVAAAFAAIYPAFVYLSPLILCDTFSHTAILAALLLILKLREKNYALAFAAVLGIAFAAAALIKPSCGLLPVFYAIIEFFRAALTPVLRRKIAVATGATLVSFALAMSGWWMRNYREFSAWTPFSTMSGFTLWESNRLGANGGTAESSGVELPMPPLYSTMRAALAENRQITMGEFSRLSGIAYRKDARQIAAPLPDGGEILIGENTPLEIAADRYLSAAATKIMFAHPGRTLKLGWQKFQRTWNFFPNWKNLRAWHYQAPVAIIYGAVIIFAIAGALIFYRDARRAEIYLLWLPAVYFALVHTVYLGSLRYRMPAEGALIILAAGTVDYLWRTRFARKKFF